MKEKMMTKRMVVIAIALFCLVSINAHSASAQSCPTSETYGVREPFPVDRSIQSQIEVTYFTTGNRDAFMNELAGLNRSGSYSMLHANEFVAQLNTLKRSGLASIKKQQSATTFLGEVATLNLERQLANTRERMVNASHTSVNPNSLRGLDRQSEISVFKGPESDGAYYRVSLLSWFVNGGRKYVDYDAIILLKPGQTAIFKLASDDEIRRNAGARSYISITLRQK